jgi:hypothetical protein
VSKVVDHAIQKTENGCLEQNKNLIEIQKSVHHRILFYWMTLLFSLSNLLILLVEHLSSIVLIEAYLNN